MNKLIASLLLLIALGISGVAGAAPANPAPSAYADYLQTLDVLTKSAIAPPAQNLDWTRSGATGSTIAIARSLLGRPVVWGGASPTEGFDCSGLVQYVFRQAGITLPRTADLQFLVGRTVSPAALRPGDHQPHQRQEQDAQRVHR